MSAHSALISDPVLTAGFSELTLLERLGLLVEGHRKPVFTTSLGIEDQVLTAALGMAAPSVRIVTLDTGRLFPETEALIAKTETRYGIRIERFRPDSRDLEAFVGRHGLNGFYESVEARHACCGVRKLEPLERALRGADLWLTGLRRGQSGARAEVPFVDTDRDRHLIKANPLADWSRADIDAFVEANDVPVNPLHARGYPSIGCAPCTRAIKPGEDERAGRWWWENDDRRECGLHVRDTSASPIANAR